MLNNETIAFLLPFITGTVAKILGGRLTADIEDVANDTVAAMLSGGLERFEGRASLKAYAMTSARNNALNFKARVRNTDHDSITATDATSDKGEAPTGVILADTDGRHTVERSSKAASLAFALECLLDTDESDFMGHLLAGTGSNDAAALVGWSQAKGSRKRKSLTAYLAAYVADGKWEE
jgi:DNA-directed RNA polymerase specialized sigma24 family protein